MKKTLTILALTLTYSMANISIPSLASNSTQIQEELKHEIIIRESRTLRESREIRKTRSIEEVKEVLTFRLARATREIRDHRFVVQTTRESRKMRHLLIQDRLYFARLK